MLETSAFSLFTVSNLQNQHDNTKLPCYTLLPMQHHNFFQNLLPLFLLCYLCYSEWAWTRGVLRTESILQLSLRQMQDSIHLSLPPHPQPTLPY